MTTGDSNILMRDVLPPRVETAGQLIGQFAHDINNALAPLLTNVELAALSDDPARIRVLLANAVRAIERQRAITRAMAVVARACGTCVDVDLHATILAAEPDLAAVAAPGAGLMLALDAPRSRVRGDPRFLRAALLHLVAHVSARCAAGGIVSIATRDTDGAALHLPAGDRMLIVTVTCSHVRSGETARPASFDLSHADIDGGIDEALGLAQARDAVRRAGGRAAIETTPERGSSVRLAFPLAEIGEATGAVAPRD